jgi:hypothetical protein
MNAVQICFAVAPLVLEFALVARMWNLRIQRQYPLFFCFLLFDIVRAAVMFPLWRMGRAAYELYFYTYWTAEAVSVLLGFAVLWQIYQEALRNYERLQHLAGAVFRGTLIALLLLSIALAVADPARGPNPMVAAIMVLERSMQLVQAGLVLVLLALMAQLGLAWRHPLFGIALGFALFLTVKVVVFAVWADAGPVTDPVVRLLVPVSYNLAVLAWLAYLWRAERGSELRMTPLLRTNLLRWSEALTEVWQR